MKTLEQILTQCYKGEMVDFIYANPERIEQLIELALKDDSKLSWRASWLLWSCMEPNDFRVREYLGKILDVIPLKKDNHQRELLKILQNMEIDENHIGVLFDICLKIWVQLNKQPAVRYNAFKTMLRIAECYPIFINEIEFYSEERFIKVLTPGAKHSIYKMLSNFNKSITTKKKYNN